MDFLKCVPFTYQKKNWVKIHFNLALQNKTLLYVVCSNHMQ